MEREKEVSITAQQKKYNQMSRLTRGKMVTLDIPIRHGLVELVCFRNAVEREKEVSITAQQKKYNQMSRLTRKRLLTLETSQFDMGWLNWLARIKRCGKGERGQHHSTTEEIQSNVKTY